jgi:hypothetical protein
MGERARSAGDAPRTCEKCGARSELDTAGDKPRLRCTSCDHVFDVALVPVALGKWTVVDPDGVTREYASWQELMSSPPLSGTTPSVEVTGRRSAPSAAALLDVTPPPALVAPAKSASTPPERDRPVTPSGNPAPRLSLVPGDDPPPLPRNRVPRIETPTDLEPIAEVVSDEDIQPASVDGRGAPASAPAAVPAAADSDPEISPVALAMPLPTAVRRSTRPPPPLPTASVRPPAPSTADESSEPSPLATPPPPKGGTLKTLPPPARHDAPAPPPPTIDVESDPVVAVPAVAVPPVAAMAKSPRASDRSTATVPPRRASREIPRPAVEPAPRSWFGPAVAVGLIAVCVVYVVRSPSTAPTAEPATPDTAQAQAPVATTSAAASTSAPASASASTSTNGTAPTPLVAVDAVPPASAGGVPAHPAGAGEAAPRKVVGDSQLSLSEVLERAAQARKSGDAAHAKALLHRALELSPGNAEAHGLLGDLARSQGDQAGAKDSYEKALATSPGYFPAQLGLADALWDLGERDAARRRYATLYASSRATPDRVKERAQSGAAPAPAPASPAATTPSAEP